MIKMDRCWYRFIKTFKDNKKIEVPILSSLPVSHRNLSFPISIPLTLTLTPTLSLSLPLPPYRFVPPAPLTSIPTHSTPHMIDTISSLTFFSSNLRAHDAHVCSSNVRTYLNMSNDSTSVSTTSKPSPLGQQQHTSAELIDIYAAVAPLAAS